MSGHSAEKDAGGETFNDELDAHIAESMKDAEFAAAFEDAGARHAVLDGLLARRRATGLTQTDVGRLMGNVKQPTISEFESEPSDPRLSTVQRYARAVGLRVVVTLEEVVPLDTYVLPPAVTEAALAAQVACVDPSRSEGGSTDPEVRQSIDRTSSPSRVPGEET